MTYYNVSYSLWIRNAVVAMVYFALLTFPSFAAAPDKDMEGVWRGKVDIPDGPTVEVNLEFYKSEEGDDCLFLIVPEDDDILNIKTVTIMSDSLVFESEEAGLTFKGSLKRGEKIDGVIAQSGQSMPITFILDTD